MPISGQVFIVHAQMASVNIQHSNFVAHLSWQLQVAKIMPSHALDRPVSRSFAHPVPVGRHHDMVLGQRDQELGTFER